MKLFATKSMIRFTALLLLANNAFAEEGMVFQPNMGSTTNIAENPLTNTTFDPETFELAYRTFTNSGDVNDAFSIATNAVMHDKKSLVWRKRLAQTAIWTNNPDTALQQYIYMITIMHQENLLPGALKIANDLSRYEALVPLLEYQYKKHPNNPDNILNLARAYDRIGSPEHAVALLKAADHKKPNKAFLQLSIEIYRGLGDYQNELAALQKMQARFGVMPMTTTAIAKIQYSHADPTTALATMKSANSKDIKDADFWQAEARLAWLTADFDTSLLAYTKLYEIDKIDESGLSRLLQLQPKHSANTNLAIALEIWKKFHNPDAFLLAASTALQLQNWQVLSYLYQSPVSAPNLLRLQEQPDYWIDKVSLLQHLGQPIHARIVFMNAVRQQPKNDALKVSYADFLETQLNVAVRHQQPKYLICAMNYWQEKAHENDEWANVYSRYFTLIDEPKRALLVYQFKLKLQVTDVSWNTHYASLMNELGYAKTADQLLKQGWSQIQSQLPGHERDDYVFWEKYNELATTYAPAQIGYLLSSYIAQNEGASYSPDSLMIWAISHNNYELAAYLAAYYYPNGVPAWAALRLGIMRNDQDTLHTLLADMPIALPRKDRVTAAGLLGDISLEQSLAYEGAGRNSDAERQKLLVEAMLKTASQTILMSEYEQYGTLQGPRTILKTKLFINNSESISPYASLWDAKTNDIASLASHSYVDKMVGLIFGRTTPRSNVNLDIGLRHILYNAYNVEISGDYGITSKLRVSGKLGYNKRSTLDVFMVAAGTQDEASAGLTYSLTPRDTASVNFELDNYHLQDRTPLGNGKLLSGSFEHRFWLDYPDFGIQLNASVNRFNTYNSQINGLVLRILPSTVLPTSAAFLSKNYWQTGVNFSFGDALREHYNHEFLPYANIGVLYASTSGIGETYDVGVAGSVFGRDKLAFYYTRSTTSQGQSQTNFLIGIKYGMYF